MRGSGSSRRRAGVFAVLALLCALLSGLAAARRATGVEQELGELGRAVVVERDISRGTRISGRLASSSLGTRDVPLRFLPPDYLTNPSQAFGAAASADIPTGSYLLSSQLRNPGSKAAPRGRLGPGLRPVEVVVSGGSGARPPADAESVDVLAADEPGSTSNPRVRVLARRVPLVSIEPLREGEAGDASATGSWLATLALSRSDALRVIEADNYAREVRLLER